MPTIDAAVVRAALADGVFTRAELYAAYEEDPTHPPIPAVTEMMLFMLLRRIAGGGAIGPEASKVWEKFQDHATLEKRVADAVAASSEPRSHLAQNAIPVGTGSKSLPAKPVAKPAVPKSAVTPPAACASIAAPAPAAEFSTGAIPGCQPKPTAKPAVPTVTTPTGRVSPEASALASGSSAHAVSRPLIKPAVTPPAGRCDKASATRTAPVASAPDADCTRIHVRTYLDVTRGLTPAIDKAESTRRALLTQMKRVIRAGIGVASGLNEASIQNRVRGALLALLEDSDRLERVSFQSDRSQVREGRGALRSLFNILDETERPEWLRRSTVAPEIRRFSEGPSVLRLEERVTQLLQLVKPMMGRTIKGPHPVLAFRSNVVTFRKVINDFWTDVKNAAAELEEADLLGRSVQ